jgi:glutamate--cysteine ligase
MPSPISQPLNRGDLLRTFQSYGAPRERWLVGGEFERAVVRPDGTPVGYDEPDGIRFILEELNRRQLGWKPYLEDGNLIALERAGGASITLEPGGQVELSGAPHLALADLATEMNLNRQLLLDIAEGRDLRWIACGLTPVAPIEAVHWMPKGRYRIMREYLPAKGDLALAMMKGTTSVQANFDYSDEADCARKVRLCAGVAPLTTAIFANSPLYRNRPTGFQSYRGHIWTRTDPDRTGFPPGLRDDYSHQRWVDYLLSVPMMFYRREGTWQPAQGRTFSQWMTEGIEGCFPTAADWDLHQTSVFPEVRVKRTIEVRGADCVGPELALAFCAFFTGLLYDDAALQAGLSLVDELESWGTRESRFEAACQGGLGAQLERGDQRRGLAGWSRELGEIARQGLARYSPADGALLEPLLARLAEGRSPAEDLLEAYGRDPSPEAVIAAVAY